jgi:radical SAM superfamily enzyme YgiQ (UPF0313 family)
MMRALLVNPESRIGSFSNYRTTCELIGARYPAPPLGLCTVAALLPPGWEVRLIDRNTERWDASTLDWADLVLTGGMFTQRADCQDIVLAARQRGRTVVVGGPDPSASPRLYAAADHLVLDEAEVTLPTFLEELAADRAQPVYRSTRFADMTRTPVPRFDLLRLDRYEHVAVQFTRGCPFACEFCDIPALYGHLPRAKTPAQILVELQTLYDLGARGHVNFVDDNFIGNKQLVKLLLSQLGIWLAERGWPFEFTTGASMNLADDEELLAAMKHVGFFAVFIGIESPDATALIALNKRQNTGRPIVERLRAIYRHGMWVNAGFIVGGDNEPVDAAPAIIRCIEEGAIPVHMTGLMFAMPSSPLARRLSAEGRLAATCDVATEVDGDHCTVGLNFVSRRPRVGILRDYLRVMETTYAPGAYFRRVRHVAALLDTSGRRFRPGLVMGWRELKAFALMAVSLGARRETRWPFWRTFLWALVRNPRAIRSVGSLCALYLHFGPFSRYVVQRVSARIVEEEKEERRPA